MAEKFGGYTLEETIAVGGMAEVFLAQHSGVEGFEKDLVIKRIRPHLTTVGAFVEMFLHEAKLAARLSHPNIVQIYDLGKISQAYFIAMEYIAGRDLSALLRKTREKGISFPIEYAMQIGANACDALHYAHTKADPFGVPLHIVHRDVSPENIRVAWTGAVKLLDFGIAKAANQLYETKSGEIKGKIGYMSPEQAMGKELDHRSDIFSLGVVLYECLTGEKLFDGEREMAAMQQILEARIYPPSYFREEVDDTVERIMLKALERDPHKRYQNCIEMQYDIEGFFAGHAFRPSNTHLANFIKQLFEDELTAETARRIKTPTSSSPPEPPPEDTVGTFVGAGDKTTEAILLSLPDDDLAKLERIAAQRAVPPESIVADIVSHYLKYHR